MPFQLKANVIDIIEHCTDHQWMKDSPVVIGRIIGIYFGSATNFLHELGQVMVRTETMGTSMHAQLARV